MSNERPPFRIEFRIDRASARRALVIGGSLVLLAIGGMSFAVPVNFTDGNVLTAKQLNDDFADVDKRLGSVESRVGTAGQYVVKATLVVPGNSAGRPVAALCNPGDRVLMGSCSQNKGSAMVIWENEPIISGTNGWRCGADVTFGTAQTLQALAVCSGSGVNRSVDGGVDIDAGVCTGTAEWKYVQFPPSQQCRACAAAQCCPQLTKCFLDGCAIGNDNDSDSQAVVTCLGNSCSCSL